MRDERLTFRPCRSGVRRLKRGGVRWGGVGLPAYGGKGGWVAGRTKWPFETCMVGGAWANLGLSKNPLVSIETLSLFPDTPQTLVDMGPIG